MVLVKRLAFVALSVVPFSNVLKKGGKDHASPRYIHTMQSSLARVLFNPADDPLLAYQTEDGHIIEPEWYIPILPVVLLNGAEGIGTGELRPYLHLALDSNYPFRMEHQHP